MLDIIKSIYFLRYCFSLLNESKKLKIVKYNKSFQSKLRINLINYRVFTKKCLKYIEPGKVKEYDSLFGNLLFKGEYLNGERNGKGREYYYFSALKFEGEYLNGKRNGKGKEYDIFGKVIFEGEYKDGKPWTGKGYKKNEIIYELKNGKGFVKSKLYEGEYLNGEKNEKGKEYDDYGKLIFEGDYKNGKKWTGKGYKNQIVVYELIDGKGWVKNYSQDTLIYEGEYLNGEKNGIGKEYNYHNELEFEGEYLNGQKNGKGKEFSNNLVIFEGEYLYGEKIRGKEYDNNGNLQFEGDYLFGVKSNGIVYDKFGNIIYIINNGNVIFEGEYLSNKNKGTGKEYDNEGKLIFEGEYLNGIRNGKGKEYDNNGNIIFEGEYINGIRK